MSNSTVLGSLLSLAGNLLNLIPGILQLKKAQRDEAAGYCDSIAKCLSKCYKKLEKGENVRGLCAEMLGYLSDLHKVLEKTLDAKELGDRKKQTSSWNSTFVSSGRNCPLKSNRRDQTETEWQTYEA